MVTGHQDCSVAVWELRNGANLCMNTTQHRAAIVHVSFVASSMDRLVLTMSRDNSVSILDANTLQRPADFPPGKKDNTTSPSFRHPSFRLHLNWAQATAAPFGTEATTGGSAAKKSILPGYIAAGSSDGNVYLWQPSLTIEGEPQGETAMFVRPKHDVACILPQRGDKAFEFTDKSKIQAANRAYAQYMQQQAKANVEVPHVHSVDWSRDGTALAMGTSTGTVTVWSN